MQSSEILRCFSSTVLVAIVFIISCSIFLPIEANNVGFSIDLIHRDSPESPLYNPNLTHFERLDLACQRSMQRASQIGTTSLIPDGGEYLMKISYGTPAIESFSVVDTGSDLSWIQCLPCTNCYPSVSPPFNPKYSRTFQYVSCSLSKCLQINNPQNNFCKPINKPCPYSLKYLDDSYSRGELARDTITVGSSSQKVLFPNFLFGCGHDNRGSFPHKGAGVVGFSPQQHSFVSQLSSLHHGKFSFCLAPATSSPGRISFGDQAVVSGRGVVSTPLILDGHYFVMLQAITVGTKKLRYFANQSHFSSNDSSKVNFGGRILIDSGSTVTHLPYALQLHVDVAIRKQIKLKAVAKLPFTLCYPPSLQNADIPKITFHFAGADVELNPLNTFVANSPSFRCLAILPTVDDSPPIFGNLAQTNFLVGYDLVKKRVSFKQIDCTSY